MPNSFQTSRGQFVTQGGNFVTVAPVNCDLECAALVVGFTINEEGGFLPCGGGQTGLTKYILFSACDNDGTIEQTSPCGDSWSYSAATSYDGGSGGTIAQTTTITLGRDCVCHKWKLYIQIVDIITDPITGSTHIICYFDQTWESPESVCLPATYVTQWTVTEFSYTFAGSGSDTFEGSFSGSVGDPPLLLANLDGDFGPGGNSIFDCADGGSGGTPPPCPGSGSSGSGPCSCCAVCNCNYCAGAVAMLSYNYGGSGATTYTATAVMDSETCGLFVGASDQDPNVILYAQAFSEDGCATLTWYTQGYDGNTGEYLGGGNFAGGNCGGGNFVTGAETFMINAGFAGSGDCE